MTVLLLASSSSDARTAIPAAPKMGDDGRSQRDPLGPQSRGAAMRPGLPDYWAVDALQAAGGRVHLAHPLGVQGVAYRWVKNDVRDAADLADLLRMGRLPEAYIASPAERELRELVRHRAKLVALRSGLKAQVHGCWPSRAYSHRSRTCSAWPAASGWPRWGWIWSTGSGSIPCSSSSMPTTARLRPSVG